MGRAIHVVTVVISLMAPLLLARRIQLVNISPEEAQQHITQQSLDLSYAPKLGEHPLGYTRKSQDPSTATFYHNGRIIEHPEDYVEEEYEAKQFHGQDGLGRAMFGYSDHNQARLEARNANGEVRGSYQYINPLGEDVVVHYWSDGLGFHQVDNRQVELPQPVQETAEVREARLAHMRAWEEAASLARANPDVMSDDGPFPGVQSNVVDDDDDSHEVMAALSNQHQSLIRYPSLPYSDHISPESGVGGAIDGALGDEAVVVEAVRAVAKRQSDSENDVATGTEPKGFFYSFDYPVQLVAETAAKRARDATEQSGAEVPSPQASVAVETKQEPNVPKTSLPATDERISLKAVLSGETLIDAVHDAQVSPKQRLAAKA